METTADQYYQTILDAKKNYNRDPKKYTAQSNAARDALKQMGIDTSLGAWASGNTYQAADQQYLTDKYQQQVKDMYAKQQQAQLGQLHASQQAATNKLNQQKAEYGQQIHGQKDQADVVNTQKAQALREIMAANGINASGENVTANVALQNNRQSALNALDQQMNNYSRDIGNQISAVNDPSKEQSIIAQLGAQQAQALLGAQQTAYNQAAQEAQANQSQLNWDKQFNQQNSQYDQNMGWNYYQLQNANTQAQAQSAAQIKAYQDMIAALGGGNFNPTSGGGDYSNYHMMPQAQKSPNYRNFVQDLSSAMKKTSVPESWYTPLSELVGRESSWNPSAKNPSSSARGYAQFLDSTVKNYSKYGNYNNPVDQLVMMMHYIKDRYGTPQDALKFWDKNHWY